jgi:hypothetical protein
MWLKAIYSVPELNSVFLVQSSSDDIDSDINKEDFFSFLVEKDCHTFPKSRSSLIRTIKESEFLELINALYFQDSSQNSDNMELLTINNYSSNTYLSRIPSEDVIEVFV